MRQLFLVAGSAALLLGCDRVKHTAKDTLRRTSETVGQSATVVADGLATGAQHEAVQIALSPALRARGLQLGKSFLASNDSVRAGRPQLSLYVIFNRGFSDTVRVRVLDNQGLEYGRSRLLLRGRADEARPVPVRFDPHTSFELGTQVVVE